MLFSFLNKKKSWVFVFSYRRCNHYKHFRSKEPVGRLQRLGNLRLLEYDDWIYAPQCQDPTPMTEDMLAEQAEVILSSVF